MEISKNTPEKFIKSKIINPFHGGIALGAIYAMDDLNSSETAVLIYIGSQTDFRHDGHSAPSRSKKQISESVKISRATVTRVLISLVEKSYLYLENNFDENGYKIENTYYLTDYLFTKYVEMMCVKYGRAHHEPTEGSPRACYNTSVAIASDDSLILAERSEEKNNEIKPIDFKSCGSQAEGAGLSLHQNDITEDKIPNSPMANMAHDENIEDEIDDIFPSVQNQFEAKIAHAKKEYPEYRELKVTSSHRKMVLIFKPKASLKSFVRDNDILFLTDQIIEKYGKESHAIIDSLFTYATENGKCGELAWNVNTVWALINAIKKRLANE